MGGSGSNSKPHPFRLTDKHHAIYNAIKCTPLATRLGISLATGRSESSINPLILDLVNASLVESGRGQGRLQGRVVTIYTVTAPFPTTELTDLPSTATFPDPHSACPVCKGPLFLNSQERWDCADCKMEFACDPGEVLAEVAGRE